MAESLELLDLAVLRVKYLGERYAPAREHLLPFCEATFPRFQRAPHIELIAAELEALERGDLARLGLRGLIIQAPPRHAKTQTVSVRFPAWAICRRPDRRIIAASYGERLAGAAGRAVRNIVATQQVFPEVRLAPDQQARDQWETTAGGQFLAVGIGTGVVGFGGDIITVDDPFKKREEAESQAQRDKIWAWWTDEIVTREERETACVIVMHRWHEDDLVGRLLAEEPERWRVLRFPALAEADDLLGRAEGEALWPWRRTAEELADVRSRVGERAWSSLFQQRPAPEQGAIFKWFPRYRPEELPVLRRIVVPIDTALGGEDETAWVAWGFDGARAYWLDAGSYRGYTPEAERRLAYFHQRIRQQYAGVPVLPLHRDNVGIDKAMAQHLRVGPTTIRPGEDGEALAGRMGMPVGPVRLPAVGGTSDEKRRTLARIVAVEFEGGRALLPDHGSAALETWLEQHKAFPYGAHDDYVETTLIALWHLFRAAPYERPASVPVYAPGL